MSDLWALPTADELADIDLTVGFAALTRGTANKRQALLKLAAVSVAILVAENAEVAQLAAIIQRGVELYRERADNPTVILGPGVQAKLDSDPKLKAAFAEMSEKMTAAMQGVKEGRYKSFNEAMEAISGQRPEPLSEEDLKTIEQFEAEMLPTHKTKQ